MKNALRLGMVLLLSLPGVLLANDKKLVKIGYIDIQKTLRTYAEGKSGGFS